MQRRVFLNAIGALSASAWMSKPVSAQSNDGLSALGLRGGLSASEFGVAPDLSIDQTAAFQAMVDAAANRQLPLFLPGGVYVIGPVNLPDGLVMHGVPGRTQLVPFAGGTVLTARNLDRLNLSDLAIDALNRPPEQGAEGAVDLRGVQNLIIDGIDVTRAGGDALHMAQCGGRVANSRLTNAGRFALFSVDGKGLTVADNHIADCGNGGIIVHRSESGHDGAIIAQNRVTNIGATNGGTGQWGNAINLFRADDVLITGNRIDGAAFSTIRGNAARNIQIVDNNCRTLGETAIYSEFGFENAVVSRNFIDGASNGISVTNFNDGGRAATVTGNIIRNIVATGPYAPDPPGFGTGIAVEADATVTANMIDGAALFGINAGWGPYLRDCVISANVIRNANIGVGFSAAAGAGTVMIKDNLINARDGAIRGHQWADLVTGDLLLAREELPANAIIDGNRAG